MVERQTYELKEYAKLMGCSVNTLKARIVRGDYPGERRFNQNGSPYWILKKPLIDDWLRSQPVPHDDESEAA